MTACVSEETGWQHDANDGWTPRKSYTDMCLYLTYVVLFSFTLSASGVGSPDAEPGSGSRAPGVSPGLRRSSNQPAHPHGETG